MRRDDTMGAIRIVTLLALLGTALPASGDLLVTRDGSRIETRGPWEVRDRLVVFTRADGTLASIRLREVDLEASEEATAAAAAEEKKAQEASDAGETPEKEPAEKEAAWVLTDADFTRRLIIEDSEETGEATGEAPEGDAARTEPGRPPVVLSYEPGLDELDRHVRITGTLANKSRATASSVSLEVSLFDEQENLIQMRRAEVAETILTPGAETSFEADFPDVFSFAAVQFRPRSVNLETNEGEGARIPGPEEAAREQEELGAEEPPGG